MACDKGQSGADTACLCKGHAARPYCDERNRENQDGRCQDDFHAMDYNISRCTAYPDLRGGGGARNRTDIPGELTGRKEA